jgi:inositol-phosphate transport system permease protein
LEGLEAGLTADQIGRLVRAAYTGWIWTDENFRKMFMLPETKNILLNTGIYVSTTLVFNIGFALVLAITTFYLPKGQSSTFRALWLLPRISPSVLYVLLWKWLAWDTGFMNAVLGHFGVAQRNWMLDTTFNAWVFVILINGFIGASMGMILFSSAITAIPKLMLYASEVDGANRWQQVRYIILPQLKWPILFVTVYQTLSLLTSFEQILLSTDGGPGSTTEVWALSAYHSALDNYWGNLQYGYGAALALVLVLIGIIMSVVYLRFFRFQELVRQPRIEQ